MAMIVKRGRGVKTPVVKTDSDGNVMIVYNSLTEAAEKEKTSKGRISNCIKYKQTLRSCNFDWHQKEIE